MFKIFSRKWIRSKLLYFASCLFIPLALHASTGFAKTEQDIKAAYLFNFMKFISWPSFEGLSTFNLCVIGEDPAIEKIKLLESRSIHNLSLHVEQLYSLEGNTNCHAVFVGESEKKFIDKIINYYSETPTLTISSMDNFVSQGGMIGFITLGNIIRFDINLKQARETQLSISSKLLELANQVEK